MTVRSDADIAALTQTEKRPRHDAKKRRGGHISSMEFHILFCLRYHNFSTNTIDSSNPPGNYTLVFLLIDF